MNRLLYQILAAVLGLWLAVLFVPGVYANIYAGSSFFGFGLTAQWQLLVLLGIIIGLLNFFVKPILNAVALPLRLLTFGLFGFFINMALIWAVDMMFQEFSAPWFFPLFWTTLIIWLLTMFSAKTFDKNEY